MKTTPMEEAILNAHEFAAGMAALGIVHDLVKKSTADLTGSTDLALPLDVRIQARQDANAAIQMLSLIATTQAVVGISA